MQADERTEFDRQMSLLCAAFNVPLGDRQDAYWQAFNKLGLLEFARMVEYAVGESGTEKMPSVHALWGVRRMLKYRLPVVENEKPPHGDFLYGCANRVMFQWLWERIKQHGRLTEEQLQRVVAVKNEELAAIRMLLEEKDPEATKERLISRFEFRANKISEEQQTA